jgi:hypothetical protein
MLRCTTTDSCTASRAIAYIYKGTDVYPARLQLPPISVADDPGGPSILTGIAVKEGGEVRHVAARLGQDLQARIKRARGRFAYLKTSSRTFLREKQREIEEEYSRHYR